MERRSLIRGAAATGILGVATANARKLESLAVNGGPQSGCGVS